MREAQALTMRAELANGLSLEPAWAMREHELRALVQRAVTLDAETVAVMQANAQAVIDPTLMVGSVAVIDVAGPLMKQKSWARLLGQSNAATLPEIAAAVDAAAANPQVKGILLHGDTPGGTVSGTELAAEAVWNARQSGKPVWSFAQDCACSAGWWILSQAEKVYANATADLVNLGVYLMFADFSKALEEFGIKVHLVSSGDRKAAGNPYVVTDKHLEELQGNVQATHELFVDVVARGRGLPRKSVEAVADGRVLKGEQARAAGMIDGVSDFRSVMTAMLSEVSGGAGSNVTVGAVSAAGVTAGGGMGAMDMKLNTGQVSLLRSLGLGEDATDAQVELFVEGLNAQQAQALQALADSTAPEGGQGQGGQAAPAASGGGDGGGSGLTLNSAGGQPQSAGGVVPPAAPVVDGAVPGAGAEPASRSELQGLVTEAGALLGEGFNSDEFVAFHTLNRSTSDHARSELVSFIQKERKPLGMSVSVGDDGREGFAAALGDVMSLRMGQVVEKPHARVESLNHRSMVEIGREYLSGLGVPGVNSMMPERVGQLMIDRMELSGYLGGVALSHTTSDFPGILSTSAKKTLVDGFEQEETTYQAWARNEELPDLHEWEEHSGGGVPRPKRVPELGEYELVTFGFKAEMKRVYKHGLKVGLSLEMLIQDNLGAFAERLMDFGGAARALRNQLVYDQLVNNGTMNEDSTALFHGDHNNLNKGGAGAPTLAILSAMRTAMRLQKGVSPDDGVTEGRNIRITPAFVLLPEELVDATTQLIASTVDPGKSNGTPNYPFIRQLTPVSDPELSDASTTAWYMLGQKRKSPVKSLTLRGYATPTVTRTNKVDNDSIMFQLRDFCGAARVEWRSGQKNNGA